MEAIRFINSKEQILRCLIRLYLKDKTLKLADLYWRIVILNDLVGVAKRSIERSLGWPTADIKVF
jgi:hypothetical protein